MTTTNVPRCHPVSPDGQNCPHMRVAALTVLEPHINGIMWFPDGGIADFYLHPCFHLGSPQVALKSITSFSVTRTLPWRKFSVTLIIPRYSLLRKSRENGIFILASWLVHQCPPCIHNS